MADPLFKTRTDLLNARSREEKVKISKTTSVGIASSLELKRLQDIEDRKREPEEMSTIGMEINLNEKPATFKQLSKQR